MADSVENIRTQINNQPKFDIHEHLCTPAMIRQLRLHLTTLGRLSYIGPYDFYPGLRHPICQNPFPGPPSKLEDYSRFLQKYPFPDMRECFIAGINAIYGHNLHNSTIEKLNEINSQIQSQYKEVNGNEFYYASVFSRYHIKHVIGDFPHSRVGLDIPRTLQPEFGPEIQVHGVVRLNSLLFAFDPNGWNSNTDLISFFCRDIARCDRPDNFDEFLSIVDKLIAWGSQHFIGWKCASAYERTLNFGDPIQNLKNNYDNAKKVYNKPIESVSEKCRIDFGNFMMAYFLDRLKKHPLPIQFHTGMAIESGSHPNFLRSLIVAFPEINFELLHCGYPWVEPALEIVKEFSNVYSDFVWIPQLNQKSIARMLRTIEKNQLWNKILGYGGDCGCIEGSIGALVILCQNLAKEFNELKLNGLLSNTAIENAIESLFWTMPRKFFQI
jgi:hypothetical protein